MPSRRLLAELRGATLESRFEEMGLKRQPVLGIPVPYGQIPARLPQPAIHQRGDSRQWVAAFVDWYNHRHHHSAIKFVTPHQRHSGSAAAIYQQRAVVYEAARHANPTRWRSATRCWNQLAEVWINKRTEDPDPVLEIPLV